MWSASWSSRHCQALDPEMHRFTGKGHAVGRRPLELRLLAVGYFCLWAYRIRMHARTSLRSANVMCSACARLRLPHPRVRSVVQLPCGAVPGKERLVQVRKVVPYGWEQLAGKKPCYIVGGMIT